MLRLLVLGSAFDSARIVFGIHDYLILIVLFSSPSVLVLIEYYFITVKFGESCRALVRDQGNVILSDFRVGCSSINY